MSAEQDAGSWVNADQAAGEYRIRHTDLFDAEVRPHNERFREAAAVAPGDRVLDIGCGAGQSTREAGQAAGSGSVVGVDLSAGLLEVARKLADSEGLRNVSYLRADAQVHRFPPEHFDLCISRFGAMFFAGPEAAFGNIAKALRPGGRLVLLVWQAPERNEWWRETGRVLGGASSGGTGPGMFSLADTHTTRNILAGSGFTEISFTDVAEPVYYGPDPATAADLVLGFRNIQDQLASLEPAAAEQARQRLLTLMEQHAGSDGVRFGSRTWIIGARRSYL